MSLNPVRNKKICNLEKSFYTSLNLRFDLVFLVLSIIVTFWSFYVKVLAETYNCPQDGQFAKHCQTPLNHRFQLDFWCISPERHFEAVTVKFSLNAITTKKIADNQNSVTPL